MLPKCVQDDDMPIITAIKPQKNKKRVNIYLDYKFGFGLDLENYVKAKLKVEQELTEEEIQTIVMKGEYQKTQDKLLRFVTTRPRSLKEVKDWYKKHDVAGTIQSTLIEKMVDYGFLDDKKFAIWWVEQRNTFRPRGKTLLKNELLQKGIDRNIIQEVLLSTKLNEKEEAIKLLEKKRRLWEKEMDKKKRHEKMVRLLASRGYGWDTIGYAVKQINTLSV